MNTDSILADSAFSCWIFFEFLRALCTTIREFFSVRKDFMPSLRVSDSLSLRLSTHVLGSIISPSWLRHFDQRLSAQISGEKVLIFSPCLRVSVVAFVFGFVNSRHNGFDQCSSAQISGQKRFWLRLYCFASIAYTLRYWPSKTATNPSREISQ